LELELVVVLELELVVDNFTELDVVELDRAVRR
jgi:hypothetical protein